MKKSIKFLALIGAAFLQYSCVKPSKDETRTVTLIPAKEIEAQGFVTFKKISDDEIKVTGKITGLSPGEHGMHLHTVGDCSDPGEGFKKSGGHFNPDHTHHGALMDGHSGDLGNITADATGTAEFTLTTKKFNLMENDTHSILGRALVVHAGQDDEKTDPAGNSGGRILCGQI